MTPMTNTHLVSAFKDIYQKLKARGLIDAPSYMNFIERCIRTAEMKARELDALSQKFRPVVHGIYHEDGWVYYLAFSAGSLQLTHVRDFMSTEFLADELEGIEAGHTGELPAGWVRPTEFEWVKDDARKIVWIQAKEPS